MSTSKPISNTVVAAFAIWTIVCHVTVFLGGSLQDLLRLAAVCLPAFLAVAVLLRQRKAKTVAGPPTELSSSEPSVATQPPSQANGISGAGKGYRAAVFVGATFTTLLHLVTGYLWALWIMGVVSLGAGLVHELGSSPRWMPPVARRSWEVLLWTLCAFGAAIALLAQKPNVDDGGILLLAVSAVDHPQAALFGPEFLNGLPSLPPAFLVYQLHSLELLVSALSYLTGLPVLDIAHLAIPCLAGFLVPLAFANLFRLVIPRRWIWGVVVVTLVLLMLGDTPRSFGNFAFIRLHQGKAILLTVGLPLLTFYGLSFALQPSWERWWRLAAAQIACAGLSSTALWIAPLVTVLSVVCGLDRFRRPLRVFLAGVSSSGYLVLLAVGMWFQVYGVFDSSSTMISTELMRDALAKVLGYGPMSALSLLVAFGAWTLMGTSMERRVAIVFPLAFVVFWNPFLAKFFAETVTHPLTYWRVFWILPLPILLTLVSSAPIEAGWFQRAPSALRITATLGGAAAIFCGLSQVSVLSSENGVRWSSPFWKVPPEEFAAACSIVEHSPAGAWVVAPSSVSTWITTIHQHPRPLAIRRNLVVLSEEQLGTEEARRRLQLNAMVSGWPPPDGARLLSDAIDDYRLAAAAIVQEASTAEIQRVLRDAGMSKVGSSRAYQIWSMSQERRDFRGSRRCWEYSRVVGLE